MALGRSQAGWAPTQHAWELPVVQEDAWVGPGIHRLDARQQQGATGSYCATAWMHVNVGCTAMLQRITYIPIAGRAPHDTLLQEEYQHRTGLITAFRQTLCCV